MILKSRTLLRYEKIILDNDPRSVYNINSITEEHINDLARRKRSKIRAATRDRTL